MLYHCNSDYISCLVVILNLIPNQQWKLWRILLETLLIWLHIGNYLKSCKPNLNSFNLCLSHQEQFTHGLPGVLLNGLGFVWVFFFQFSVLMPLQFVFQEWNHESTDISAGVPKSHSGSLHIWWEITQHFRTTNMSYFSYSQIPKRLKKKKKWEDHI